VGDGPSYLQAFPSPECLAKNNDSSAERRSPEARGGYPGAPKPAIIRCRNAGFPVAREQHKLAAILAADVVGYSRLTGRDECGTLAALKALRQERKVVRFQGVKRT
jgi:class 3 adenylate cyclase